MEYINEFCRSTFCWLHIFVNFTELINKYKDEEVYKDKVEYMVTHGYVFYWCGTVMQQLQMPHSITPKNVTIEKC